MFTFMKPVRTLELLRLKPSKGSQEKSGTALEKAANIYGMEVKRVCPFKLVQVFASTDGSNERTIRIYSRWFPARVTSTSA